MPDDNVQAYENARVEDVRTIADYYRNYAKDPEVFVAGAQYALDKILGQSERYYSLVMPEYSRIGAIISINQLYSLGLDILEKAKRGEPQ